jgi:hypothetical protein
MKQPFDFNELTALCFLTHQQMQQRERLTKELRVQWQKQFQSLISKRYKAKLLIKLSH